MSPRRPRRRARRRSPARPLTLLIVVVVLLAIVVGGLTQVSRQSQGYDANSARALAAQGKVAADQSNATAVTVRRIVNALPSQTRQGLQASLDSAVQQTADEAARAQLAAGSTPLGAVATQFADVFAQRAQAVAELRGAVYGFLGMQPLAAAGAPASVTSAATGASAVLSAAQASNRIASAGALLARSDALYRSVQRSLREGSGHATLPASVWVTHPQIWQAGSVATQVDLVATSNTLTATHYVVLRTERLSPPALPTPQGTPAGVSVISPTSQVGVTVVVANQGSSNEPHVSVRCTLMNQASGATSSQVRTTALPLGASATLPEVTFRVKPSTAYQLTIQVIPPAGQTLVAGTALGVPLQIAPGT